MKIRQHLSTSIHLHEFVNIDIFRKGEYKIQVKLVSWHPSWNTNTFCLQPHGDDMSPTPPDWSFSSTEVYPGSGKKYVSQPLKVAYKEQVCVLDKLVHFTTIIERTIYTTKDAESDILPDLELYAKISLLFDENKEQVSTKKSNQRHAQ